VTDEVQVEAMVRAGVDRYGRLDMAFNNAGIMIPTVNAADEAADRFDAVTAVNLRGVWASMKHGRQGVGVHGATVMKQALPLGLVDELRVHVIPVLLGGGTPLFGPLDWSITLERANALVTPAATHIMFRVIR
jgi:NAD(P)-dependent dehydrogenase (short-subunit alcohol dehydrogenase family)